MKTLLLIAIVACLSSCEPPETRWSYYGKITSLRLDDDAEYHFSTDNFATSDVYRDYVQIQREGLSHPEIYIQQEKTRWDEWIINGKEEYLIKLPRDYKIETFND